MVLNIFHIRREHLIIYTYSLIRLLHFPYAYVAIVFVKVTSIFESKRICAGFLLFVYNCLFAGDVVIKRGVQKSPCPV